MYMLYVGLQIVLSHMLGNSVLFTFSFKLAGKDPVINLLNKEWPQPQGSHLRMLYVVVRINVHVLKYTYTRIMFFRSQKMVLFQWERYHAQALQVLPVPVL